jgi:hypothetical protein
VVSVLEHERVEALEVVVELAKPFPSGGREHEVAGAGEGDARRQRGIQLVGAPAE